jgi:hypothetical protein
MAFDGRGRINATKCTWELLWALPKTAMADTPDLVRYLKKAVHFRLNVSREFSPLRVRVIKSELSIP